MQIGVNATCLSRETPAGTGNTIRTFLWELCRLHPEDTFVFFLDHANIPDNLPDNVAVVVILRKSDSDVQKYLWREWKLPRSIRKNRIDLFINPDGWLPLRSKAKQVLLINNIDFRERNTLRYLQRAAQIIVLSHAMEKEVLKISPATKTKLQVAQPGIAPGYRPFEWEERQAAKQEFCGGVEYFVVPGDLHPRNNILPLLKAFSALKRRLHSNMKLVLAGQPAAAGEEITTSLASYKFRNDVILLPDLDQPTLARLIAGAYAMVYTNRLSGVAAPVYAALLCQVPVVAIDGAAAREAGGDAVLYANPDDLSDLAEKMSLVYKDEQLRSTLVKKGAERVLPTEVIIPSFLHFTH